MTQFFDRIGAQRPPLLPIAEGLLAQDVRPSRRPPRDQGQVHYEFHLARTRRANNLHPRHAEGEEGGGRALASYDHEGRHGEARGGEKFYEVRRSGLIAIGLDKGDSLISAQFAYKGDDAILVTAKGQSIRFRAGRCARWGGKRSGVRGMKLGSGDSIVGAGIVPKDAKDAELLVLSSTGYGKKTKLSEYKTQGRGGSGVKTMSITPKTKQLVGGAIVLAKGGDAFAMSKKKPDHPHADSMRFRHSHARRRASA